MYLLSFPFIFCPELICKLHEDWGMAMLFVVMTGTVPGTEQVLIVCVCSVVSDTLQPMDCCLTGSSVHGILQARILKWDAISSSRGSSRPGDGTHVSCVSFVGRQFFFFFFFATSATWESLNKQMGGIGC